MVGIRDLFSLEDERKALEDGYLTIRKSGSLRVYNYSDKAAIDSESWKNPAVLQSRGIVVDKYDTVLARPWSKFFNHNQPQVGELNFQEPVEVTDKKDGSAGILFPYGGYSSGVGITTRGSLESDQARHGQSLLESTNTLWDGYIPGDIQLSGAITPITEIVYKDNRIVLNYGDLDNLILLGGVVTDTGQYLGPEETAKIIGWHGLTTEVLNYTNFQEAIEAKPRGDAEGLVVRFKESNKLVKIKESWYVQAHKAIFGMNELAVWEYMMEGTPLSEILEPLPDEIHKWVIDTYVFFDSVVDENYLRHLSEYECLQFELGEEYSRKDFALAAKSKNHCITSVLFNLEDGKTDAAWYTILKTLRPTGGGEKPILEQNIDES